MHGEKCMGADYEMFGNIFRKDGFVHIERFLEPRQSDEMEANLARFTRDVVPSLSKSDAMYQSYGEPETLKQITRLEIDPFFASLLSGSRVQTLAETLLQQRVIPQSIQFFNKPPRIGTATPPHQDGYYFCLVPNEALTVWIALDDIDRENGALHYWKGSHKRGVLQHSASHVLGFSQGLTEQTDLGEETICSVKRGDCLIHHSLMVHAAGPNPSQRSRRAVGLTYYSECARIDAAAQSRYQESVLSQQRGQSV
jgi:phytanoyl-CoA hydroxylase